jgi:hypothetical protein
LPFVAIKVVVIVEVFVQPLGTAHGVEERVNADAQSRMTSMSESGMNIFSL